MTRSTIDITYKLVHANSRTVSNFTGVAPRVETAPIFKDGGEFEPSAPTSQIVPANVGLLFRVLNPKDRFGTPQTNHFANTALGLREKPRVQRVVDLEGPSVRQPPLVQALFDRVVVARFANVDEGHYALSSFSPKTGEVKTFNFAKEGFVTVQNLPQHFVATRSGVAFGLKFASLDRDAERLEVAHVDARRQKVAWRTKISSDPRTHIGFIHQTAGGDIAVLYGSLDAIGAKNTRLAILDEKTGEIKKDSLLAGDLRDYGVRFDTNREKPLVFFFDDVSDTAVVGLKHVGYDREGLQLYTIDFKSGRTKRSATPLNINMYKSTFTSLAKGQSLIVETREEGAPSIATLMSYRAANDLDRKRIELRESSSTSFVTNCNQAFAVKPNRDSISFFSITADGFVLIKTDDLSNEIAPNRPDAPEFYAITQDDVVYCSMLLQGEQPDGKYRLYAHDATTGRKLWHLDEVFSGPPAVMVNDDNSITWMSQNKALILEP